jgi:hypothetical protein
MPCGFVLITGIDGVRYAVRHNAIAAIQDADEYKDDTLVPPHGGAGVRVSAEKPRSGRHWRTAHLSESAFPLS